MHYIINFACRFESVACLRILHIRSVARAT